MFGAAHSETRASDRRENTDTARCLLFTRSYQVHARVMRDAPAATGLFVCDAPTDSTILDSYLHTDNECDNFFLSAKNIYWLFNIRLYRLVLVWLGEVVVVVCVALVATIQPNLSMMLIEFYAFLLRCA